VRSLNADQTPHATPAIAIVPTIVQSICGANESENEEEARGSTSVATFASATGRDDADKTFADEDADDGSGQMLTF